MAGIEVKNLSKSFKTFKAVNDISFSVEPGRVVGFLGPNGAGKTTTLRMLVGLSHPDKGEISIAGQRIVFGEAANNTKFGYLPEQPAFYGWMTGTEYLGFIADTYSIKAQSKTDGIKEVLKIVDLIEAKDRRIAGYSNGMKQRLGIAQALLNDPEVLIMDEPVSALDPIGRREILRIITDLKKEKTILFSTHILSDVDRICDDVVIINKGKIVAQSSLIELKEKYSKPILEIEFSADPSSILSNMRQQEWAKKVEGSGNQIKIWLNDSGALDQNVPLKYISEKGISVLRYGLMLPEVEDLFIDLVEEDK